MKRSDRLIGIVNFLLNNPKKRVQLSYFIEKYNVSKSSISEDLNIINKMFHYERVGYIDTASGVSGGISYIPLFNIKDYTKFADMLCDTLKDPNRILPGGYLYMSDLLGDPNIVRQVGQIFSTSFAKQQVDAVVTIETKGISLAYAVAQYLNVPVVIVRRDPKVTEGSSVSINYVSGSAKTIQTMVLPKRNLKEGSNVCIVDDFMKAGGTITGIVSLMEEFKANVVGIGVLAETANTERERIIDSYISLINILDVDSDSKTVHVVRGNVFNRTQ